MINWHRWLIDVPAHLTEVGATWYRLFFTWVILAVAVVCPFMVLSTLVLWFGFGIRWGW